jgi:hypothetical protein
MNHEKLIQELQANGNVFQAMLAELDSSQFYGSLHPKNGVCWKLFAICTTKK